MNRRELIEQMMLAHRENRLHEWYASLTPEEREEMQLVMVQVREAVDQVFARLQIVASSFVEVFTAMARTAEPAIASFMRGVGEVQCAGCGHPFSEHDFDSLGCLCLVDESICPCGGFEWPHASAPEG